MPGKVKKGVKRAFKNAKRELAPAIKAVAREAIRAAKNEYKAQGGELVARGAKFAMKNIFGSGDYRTNNLIKGGVRSTPSFGTSQSTFRRREPLGQVVSSATAGAYSLQKFRINPGLGSSFPWLSGFANNYESWRPTSVILEYVPTSGMSVASGDTALGSVTMAAQYNPFAVDPQNLIQIQGYPNSVTAAPWEHSLCGLECVASKRQSDTLLIRNANISANGGLTVDTGYDTLFDLCEFFIATEGCQVASVKLGQLWITYEIQLSNPIIPTVQNFNPGLTLASLAGTNYSTVDLFSSVPSVLQWSGIPIAYSFSTANRLNLPLLPPGSYQLELTLKYTAVTTQTSINISSIGLGIVAQSDLNAPQPTLAVTTDAVYITIITTSTSTAASYIQLNNFPAAATIDRYTLRLFRIPSADLAALGP